MDVRITARHCSITDSVRDVAQSRVARLTRYDPRVRAAEVLFREENGSKHVEVRVRVPGAVQLQAHAEARSFRTALDRSVERLERQARRRHMRRRDKQSIRTLDVMSAD